jgi:hypothetical protein
LSDLFQSSKLIIVWYPPLSKDFATPVDKFLVMQKNPIKHIDWPDEDIVFHEIVHTLSVRQPQKQKEEISNAFLDLCPMKDKFPKLFGGNLLEEPMAVVVGQILFLKRFFPDRLKWDSKLYNDPWVSSFAKLIYPVVENEIERKQIFSVETGKKLGFLCKEVGSPSNDGAGEEGA